MENQLNEHLDQAKALRTLRSLLSSRDFSLARALANECIRARPDVLEFYLLLIDIERTAERKDVVLLIYPELIRRSQDFQDMSGWYKMLFRDRDYDVILEHFSSIWEKVKKHPLTQDPYQDAWFIVLRCALRARRLDLFEQFYSQLAQLRRKNPEYYLLMGVYYLQTQKSDMVLNLVDEGFHLFSDKKELLLISGMSYFVKGQMDKAERMFLRARHMGSILALSYLLQIKADQGAVQDLGADLFS